VWETLDDEEEDKDGGRQSPLGLFGVDKERVELEAELQPGRLNCKLNLCC